MGHKHHKRNMVFCIFAKSVKLVSGGQRYLPVIIFVNHFLSVVPRPPKNSDFRPTTYNTVTKPTTQPPYCTLAATHTARLQVGWYIIFMASEEVVGKWWGGGGVTRRLQARFWSLVQITKIAN
jgi:hypothetical protein